MKKIKVFVLGLTLLSAGILSGPGCGSEASFIIVPGGPTAVIIGETLQFTVEPVTPVTWSVNGGAGNGSIDATGLYTAPAQLPVDPRVTVTAQDADGNTAGALVDLKTGDTLTFGGPDQVNDTPVQKSSLSQFFFTFGMMDRIAASVGSLHVNLAWPLEDLAGDFSAQFDKNVDFMGFGTDVDIGQDEPFFHVPGAVLIFNDLNPGILTMSQLEMGGDPRLQFFRSSDQGATFFQTSVVDPTIMAADAPVQPAAKLDGQDGIHVAFIEGDTTAPATKVFYTRSDDRGDTWSTPIPVGNDATDQLWPHIAVSDDGMDVYVCFTDVSGGGSDQNIMLASSHDGGANFGNPVPISNSGDDFLCRTALDPEGRIFVSYDEISGVDNRVLISKSSDGGANFTTPLQVNSGPAQTDGIFIYMSIDSLGRIDMVWSADIDGSEVDNLMYSRSLDHGETFSPEVEIDGNGAEVIVLAMGLTHDEAGRLHIQYLSDVNDPFPGTTYDIFYMLGE